MGLASNGRAFDRRRIQSQRMGNAGVSWRGCQRQVERRARTQAGDFHLVQTQVRDAADAGAPLESLTVYVLALPGQSPQIFKTFDSKPMQKAIGDLRPGSYLYYDGNARMAPPPAAQLAALKAFCQMKGINLVLSPT